jgi:branched-chain amino acid transport system substrate-binding protein
MRFPFRSFVAVAAAFGLVGSAAAKETVKIGAALSMTGPAAVYGSSQKACIQIAAEQVNKSGALKDVILEPVIEDDASVKEQGIAVFQKFINRDRVSVIVGPTLSNTATAADQVAQQQRVPVLAISNTAPKGITDIGDYVWRVSLNELQVIVPALKRIQSKVGFKKAALLYGNDDAFTQAGYNVMKASLGELKIEIVGEQTFAKPDRDYNAQLTQLRSLHPDLLMVSALAENAAGILTQARQLGWNVTIMGGNGFNSPALLKNAGAAAEGVFVGTAWNKASDDPANQAFLASMKSRGIDPDQFCAQAYTAVVVIGEAIKQAGMKGGREDIRAGFAKVKDLPTPLGKFSFLSNRDAGNQPALQQVKDGRFQIVP